MCGLCGVISTDLSAQEIEAFQHLMCVSTIRGYYGSGLVAVPSKVGKAYEILRHEEQTAGELAHTGEFYQLVKKGNDLSMLMGHARQPTKGGFSIDDTHPHSSGNIIGMHNGTMQEINGEDLPTGKNAPSDSKLLFEAIDKHGIEHTIKNSKGAYALSYINKKAHTVHFIRNKERSLFWARVGRINTLYWASEANFLHLVLKRLYTSYEVSVFGMKPDTLLTFDTRPSGQVEPRVTELKPVPLLPAPSVITQETGKTTYPESLMYPTLPGRYLTERALKMTLINGCCFCSNSVGMPDYEQKTIYWTDVEEFVCESCARSADYARDYMTSKGIQPPTTRH